MHNEEKNYLLLVYGDKTISGISLKDMLGGLTIIDTSKYIKFIHGNYGVVCRFTSNTPFNLISAVVHNIFKEEDIQYFLFEETDKLSVKMDDNLIGELFDSETTEINIAGDEAMENIEEKEIIDEMYDMLLNNLKTFMGEIGEKVDEGDMEIIKMTFESPIVKDEIKNISLNDILDKVSLEGVKSLTKQEMKILETYGSK